VKRGKLVLSWLANSPELRAAVLVMASEKPEMLAPPFERFFKKAKNRDGTSWGLKKNGFIVCVNDPICVLFVDNFKLEICKTECRVL
jgi:hypothetical protein